MPEVRRPLHERRVGRDYIIQKVGNGHRPQGRSKLDCNETRYRCVKRFTRTGIQRNVDSCESGRGAMQAISLAGASRRKARIGLSANVDPLTGCTPNDSRPALPH